MDLPIAVVSANTDHFCRACFKELNTATAAEANARVNMLEMPGLMDKLSACISNIFITTKGGSKYLCLECFKKVNEFHEFREMCLQSMRRFEANEVSKYVITYIGDSSPSEETKDLLLLSESGIKKEFEAQAVTDLPQIFEDSSENPEPVFNKVSIKSEEENILLTSESVIKAEYELNNEPMTSNGTNTSIVNDLTDIFKDSKENEEPQFKNTFVILSEDVNEPAEMFEESMENDNSETSSGENESVSGCTLNSDSQEDVSGEQLNEILSKVEETTCTASKTTRKPAMDRTEKRKTFSCGKCQKLFRKEMKFIAHIQAHEGLKPYHCTYDGCVKSFTTSEYLQKHQKRHENSNSEHVPKRFQCEYEGCDKSFRWPYSAKRHRMMHEYQNMGHDPPIYYCTYDGCDQSFSRLNGLKRHQNWHADANSEHGLKRYHCTHEGCDKAYAWPLNLKRHQERHENLNSEHGLKRYHCTHDGCDKSYAWPVDLKNHQSMHENSNTEPKRFHCTYEGCDKTFSRATTLRKHKRWHQNSNSENGPKRYHCTQEGCDKSYAWPEDLKAHQSRHEISNGEHGLKRYHCTHEGCDKSYAGPGALKAHQRRHDNPNSEHLKTYRCKYKGCDKSFPWSNSLRRHHMLHAKANSEHGVQRHAQANIPKA